MSTKDPDVHQSKLNRADANIKGQEFAAEIRRLAFLLGTWQATDKYEKNVLNPLGGEGSGTYKTILGPGRLSLLTDYHYDAPHGPSSGHQVLTWDAKLGCYTGCLVSSTFPGCLMVAGNWEGSEFVLSGEFEFRARKVVFKQIFSDITQRTMILRQYNSIDGDPARLFGTTTFTKEIGTGSPLN